MTARKRPTLAEYDKPDDDLACARTVGAYIPMSRELYFEQDELADYGTVTITRGSRRRALVRWWKRNAAWRFARHQEIEYVSEYW